MGSTLGLTGHLDGIWTVASPNRGWNQDPSKTFMAVVVKATGIPFWLVGAPPSGFVLVGIGMFRYAICICLPMFASILHVFLFLSHAFC